MNYTRFLKISFSEEEREVLNQIKIKAHIEFPYDDWKLCNIENEPIAHDWFWKVVDVLEKYNTPQSPVAALLSQFYQMLGERKKNEG